VTVLFLFYTIFPEPLRLYVDEPDGPIVAREEVRELDARERAQVEAFIAGFLERRKPILAHRPPTLTARKLRDFARHIRVRATQERDNDYLRPGRFVRNFAAQQARRAAISRLYEPVPAERPFVYFPLHVTDDFKIKRLIPHCSDQAYLIEQLADALPQGHDLVLKEHPVSIGRNPVSMLRRLVRRGNVRLVDPYTSSHELIERSAAVAVIGSTVGLEALLFGKPVLTLGRPFYAGYGVTVDVESFREIKDKLAETLRFAPDRERILRFLGAAMRATEAGAPAGVDLSDANADLLAASLDAAARRHAAEPARPALASR
jgi:capsule polysaccharide modification protein KpsS